MSSFQVPLVSANKIGWGPSPSSSSSNNNNNANSESESLSIHLPPSLNHSIGTLQITQALKVLVADWTGSSSTGPSTGTSSSRGESTNVHSENAESFTVVAHGAASQSGPAQNTGAKRKQAWAVQKEHAQSQQKTYTAEQQKQIHRTQKKINKNRYYMATASRQQREAQQAQHYRSVTTSIEVKPDWSKVATFSFKDLESMLLDTVPTVTDIKMCGGVESYDKKYDRVQAKTPVALKSATRTYIDSTTTEDPVINTLDEQKANDDNIRIFATDQILALLVSASRTVYPWDIVVRKMGSNIYLDKRPGVAMFDLLSVNENSVRDAPAVDDRDKKNVNSAIIVTQEAVDVNANFVQQVLNPKSKLELSESPFKDQLSGADTAEPVPVIYRYRKWDLGTNMLLIARTEIDAILDSNANENARQFMTIKSLNEYFGTQVPSNWRGRLDSQRSAVLLTEYKNNSAKMTRFTAQALLSGSDIVKIGFISRITPTSRNRHVVLGTETYQSIALARTVKLDTKNMWGVIKGVASIISKQEADGVFVLLHAPNKQQLDLYRINNEGDLEPTDDGAEDDIHE